MTSCLFRMGQASLVATSSFREDASAVDCGTGHHAEDEIFGGIWAFLFLLAMPHGGSKREL